MFKFLPLIIKITLMVIAVSTVALSYFHVIKIKKSQVDLAESIIQQQTGIKIDLPIPACEDLVCSEDEK